MPLKITFKDKFVGTIEKLSSKKCSEITLSISPNKKLSDVVAYIRKGKFGKSMAGRVVRDTDTGYLFEYEYCNNGKNLSEGGYKFTINHIGEQIISIKLYYKNPGASWDAKSLLNKMEKKLPEVKGPKVAVEEIPQVNYAEKNLSDLVDEFDKKLQEFKKQATLSVLSELENIKNIMSDKVGEKPLKERGAFEKPLSNITIYIDALKMQMNSRMANPTQFVNMYVPQMSTALAEIAGLL